MNGLDPQASTARNYRRFAQNEAAGRSPAYAALAESVAADRDLLAFLNGLPALKRQPNLLFAAATYLLGNSPDPETLHRLVHEQPDALATVMHARRTQTNEAARCAVLLPALARIPGPLALLEVGAAAGLTLLPDRYSYDYAGHRVAGLDPQAPTLYCQPSGDVPLPDAVPSIAWRAGIDLNPLDVENSDDTRWLECLLWPGETGRVSRLRQAVSTARRNVPRVYRGDLLDDLARVASTAPPDATLVVYHTAVLAYVDPNKRGAFADAVHDLGAVWLSNEGEGAIASPAGTNASHKGDHFILIRDGEELLAFTDPHGTWIEGPAPEPRP
jgi:hypothetical protein